PDVLGGVDRVLLVDGVGELDVAVLVLAPLGLRVLSPVDLGTHDGLDWLGKDRCSLIDHSGNLRAINQGTRFGIPSDGAACGGGLASDRATSPPIVAISSSGMTMIPLYTVNTHASRKAE